MLRYHLAALKGNKEQVNQVVAPAKGKHGAEHCVAHAEALALARAGRLRPPIIQPGHGPGPARRTTRDGSKLPGGASGVGSRLRKCRRRKRSATEALELSKGREVQYAAGLALAFSGESSRSEALAGDLEKRFPEDAFVKYTYAPHSMTRKALESFGQNTPLLLNTSGNCCFTHKGCWVNHVTPLIYSQP